MTATNSMHPTLKDMTGQTFGELTVVGRAEVEDKHQARWICRCSCGDEVVVLGSILRKGDKKSCGCKSPRGKRGPRAVAEKAPNLPKVRRWVAERDGLLAVVRSARDEALVEFDLTAKAWTCSECGPVSCDHVATAARDLPLDLASQIAAFVAPRKPGTLSTKAGGAAPGDSANQKALAVALAKSAIARAERASGHDRQHKQVTSEVTIRKASREDLERLRSARERKERTYATPVGLERA